MTKVPTTKLIRQRTRLIHEYKTIQNHTYNYKKYTQHCQGKCLTPQELQEQKEKLYKKIEKLNKELQKRGAA